MTIKKILQEWGRKLDWFEAELLLAEALGKDRTWLAAHGDETVTPARSKKFLGFIRRRLRHEPVAYIIGHWNFYGREFLNDRRALIPRPETELLIDRALSLLLTTHHSLPTTVWDVGTGCGAIAVTLALTVPNATVIASDVSQQALDLARQNARRLGAKVRFVHANLLNHKLANSLTRQRAKQIVVVANLPYLPLSDKKITMPDVKKFEPASALFTREDGMFLIHRLLDQAATFQKKDGRSLTLLAEFDPPQASKLRRLAKKYFPSSTIAIHQDMCGRDRVLEVRSPARQKSDRRS